MAGAIMAEDTLVVVIVQRRDNFFYYEPAIQSFRNEDAHSISEQDELFISEQ